MKIVMSSGHGLKIRGARGDPVPPQLDEVDQARRLTDRVAELMREAGIECVVYHDDVSTTQSANLEWIVSHHNNTDAHHDYDISFHFNAYDGKAHGTEVLYKTQEELAKELSLAIADAGDFFDRGGKLRTDLKFLNSTREKAVLLETCFCDNTPDSQNFIANFEAIAYAIADHFAVEADLQPPEISEAPDTPSGTLFYATGRCSHFGGELDEGVSPDEGLAFIYSYNDAPHLFMEDQPAGTTGLARRLNAEQVFYVACRWDYSITPKDMLADPSRLALVRAKGKEFCAWPADWGPHEQETGRAADLSPALMRALGVKTDDNVEVIYPAPQD